IGMGQFAAGGGQEAFDWNQLWPWLTSEMPVPQFLFELPDFSTSEWIPYRHLFPRRMKASSIVGHMASRVKFGHMSLEQAVDWIRSVEPAEAEAPCTETVQEPSLVPVA